MKSSGPSMSRRDFLGAAAAALAAGAAGCSPGARAVRESSGARITRASAFRVRSERWKEVGKNSHLPSHGRFATDVVVRLETSAGVEGVGPSRASREDAAQLLGEDPVAWYAPGDGIRSPLGHREAPLWDLVGKLLDRPAWRLIGEDGPDWVPIYDGSIYFNDLEPQYAGEEVERLIYEVDQSLERGHRAFKIKVGRGFKWMEREAGFRRDVEVVRSIARFVGPEVKLMVDANNGYDLETTKRFLDAVGEELYFVEEMFPESVEEDLKLKDWLRYRGWKTLVADGESAREPAHFAPYLEAKALDVLQGDIHVFGLGRLTELARLAKPAGATLAPHNWGSFTGLYLQLVLARGIPNFLIAEQDPAATEVFDVSAWELREGKMRVPDLPGLGMGFRPEADPANVEMLWEVS